jgi:F-type H+-transporting ATPase subunit b
MDYTVIFQSTTTWVALAFVIFVVFVFKNAKTALLGMIDGRIAEIKNDIKTAENLRFEAQELVAQYKRKQKDILKDADAMLASSKKQAEELTKNISIETERTITLRDHQLKERIARIEEKAVTEIRQQITDVATTATLEIITGKLGKKENDALIAQTIQSIPTTMKKAS